MVRGLPILSICLLVAAPAAARAEPAWPPLPTVTPAQRSRVDALAAGALAALDAVPPEERPGAAGRLASDLVMLRRCRQAEPLLSTYPLAAYGAVPAADPEVLESDRTCADRLIARFAEPPPGQTERDSWSLYTAGALWRRIGQRAKAEEAVEQAERREAEKESRDPFAVWTCHGGACLSPLWQLRLWALRLSRGTPGHRDELRWASALALSQRYARDAGQPAPMIGYRVFEELLPMVVDADDDNLARLLAEQTVYGNPAALAGERMRRLFEQGRIAEALDLWPTAGTAFQAPISPAVFRANLPLFHRWREQLRTRLWRGPGELLSLLAALWVERGEAERAREALATARAEHAAVKGFDWDLRYVQRLLAVEAMLDGGGDPVAWLGRQPFPTGVAPVERDYAFSELAALLAAADRRAETRRALAAIRDPRLRRSTLVELPCRAAYGGDSAASFAVALARGHLRPSDRSKDETSEFEGASYQTFLCLVRAHRGEAAIAYVKGIDDADQRLSLLTGMPLDSGIADDTALRRRFAGLALALVEARNLWADRMVPYVAAEFERTGDFAKVERVLAHVRGGEARFEVYDRLLRVYAPVIYF